MKGKRNSYKLRKKKIEKKQIQIKRKIRKQIRLRENEWMNKCKYGKVEERKWMNEWKQLC